MGPLPAGGGQGAAARGADHFSPATTAATARAVPPRVTWAARVDGIRTPPSTPAATLPPRAAPPRAAWAARAAGTRAPPSTRAATLWGQLAELLGDTGGDDGHWNNAPEWWGSQGGGWGRGPGDEVWAADSPHNGRVSVTAHVCGGGAPGEEEWRVLRFNGVTRQSVARVRVAAAGGAVSARPECLAQEYLKTAAALAAALLGLQRRDAAALRGGGAAAAAARVLCVGLGGGSLPHFLVHHFPGVEVDAVELDPAVAAAAAGPMGLPPHPRLRVAVADGLDFLERRNSGGGGSSGQDAPPPYYDLIFLDAYDGGDAVPAPLLSPRFAAAAAAAAHPARGALVVNFHGRAAAAAAAPTFAAAMLGGGAGAGGAAFAVAARRQPNAALVVARRGAAPAGAAALRGAAARVGGAAGFVFDAGDRAGRGYEALL